MNIKNLTLQEINKKMRNYLPLFLKDTFEFQENYQFEFGEINHNIPQEYHKYFNDTDIINGASGSVEMEDNEHDFVVSLVSNADYSKALFLLLQKIDKKTGAEETNLLKSFIP